MMEKLIEEVIEHMDRVWTGEADEDVTDELVRRLREMVVENKETMARYDLTTDACESLRARLAKYEDAEGRPLQHGGVVLSDEELWSIRSQVAIHQVLRDDDSVKICVKHGRAIEQAVLARLNSSPAITVDALGKCPECDDRIACEAGSIAMHSTLAAALKRLTFAARTSGGTAGADAELMAACAQAEDALSVGSAGRAFMEAAGKAPSFAQENAAFEEWRKLQMSVLSEEGAAAFYRLGSVQWAGWQARAAISAPSHGEQVRELPPFAQKVISKLKRFEECASDSDAGGVDLGRHWLDLLTQLGLLNRVQRSPGLWEISHQGEDVLAAAPSAGSNGGDV